MCSGVGSPHRLVFEEDRAALRGFFHFFTKESIATIRRPKLIIRDKASNTVTWHHLPHGRKPTLDSLLQNTV